MQANTYAHAHTHTRKHNYAQSKNAHKYTESKFVQFVGQCAIVMFAIHNCLLTHNCTTLPVKLRKFMARLSSV